MSVPSFLPIHITILISVFDLQTSNQIISLIESSTQSVLPVILQAPNTSNLNILTSTRLYCFYPMLAICNEGVPLRHRHDYDGPYGYYNFGLRVYDSSWAWEHALCGAACPSIWRCSKDLPGVGIARWGGPYGNQDLGHTYPSASDGFDESSYLWKIEGRCHNCRCPNRGRLADLSGSLPRIF